MHLAAGAGAPVHSLGEFDGPAAAPKPAIQMKATSATRKIEKSSELVIVVRDKECYAKLNRYFVNRFCAPRMIVLVWRM